MEVFDDDNVASTAFTYRSPMPNMRLVLLQEAIKDHAVTLSPINLIECFASCLDHFHNGQGMFHLSPGWDRMLYSLTNQRICIMPGEHARSNDGRVTKESPDLAWL